MREYMFTRDESDRNATSRHIVRCDEDDRTGSGTYVITRDPVPDNYDGHGTHVSRIQVAAFPADHWEPITLDEISARNISMTRHVPSYWTA